ncbi:ribose ABC transporter permease [Mycolicibacterium murale]|jgi:ribose/xylose/arabinose/galactoside ABC-type transport system permease subunit|uniref:Ribose ABC transporter permease n=1 Tax=Mycolicibacterium murale TaxID=182220 RepID=A0A7I9WWD8_9MYCO|nr:ABC transporter permease [Mycolicibacterium murale]MCV7181044.1 ABC transporter permease [Mycolicibacterium murale]GFG62015.1 ribose ABC transporter permease [Mycolicibacterium murale]
MTTDLHTSPASAPPPEADRVNLLDFAKRHWSTIAPIATLLLLIIAFSLVDSRFLRHENFLNILRQSSVLLILATASTVVILMGSIDLSVGSILTFTAFSGALMVQYTGISALLVLLPLIGMLCGLFNGLVIAYGQLPSFLVTLGTLYAFNGLASYMAGGAPVPLTDGGFVNLFTGTFLGLPVIALWAILVLVVAIIVARSTRLGRYLYALGGNEKTSRLSGVPVRRYKVYAFMISGFLVGIAGLLQLVRAKSASPDMGEPFLLPAIAAVVMGGTPLSGGIGGPLRTVTGVLIIAILGNGMVIAAVDPFLQNVVQGLVVIAAVALTMDRRKMTLVK